MSETQTTAGGSLDLVTTLHEMIKSFDAGDPMKRSMQELVDHFSHGGAMADLHNLTPQDLEVIYSMGLNFYKSARYQEARTVFRFLCFMDYTGAKWWMGLGAASQMLKDYVGAAKAYGYCTLLDVDDPKPQLQAGYCLLAAGRRDEARAALEGVLMTAGDASEHVRIRQQAEALMGSLNAG